MLLDIQIDTFRSIKASQPAGPAFRGDGVKNKCFLIWSEIANFFNPNGNEE